MNLLKKDRIAFLISPYKRFLRLHLREYAALLQNDVIMRRKSYIIVLDVGAGTSPYRDFFESKDWEYVSIDVVCNRGLNLKGSAGNLPIKSESVDVVLLLEVLEHIFETREVLSELNRVLRIGGIVVLTAPLIIGYHDSIDFYRFTHTALERLLNESGFDIIRIEKRGGIFSSASAVLLNIPSSIFKGRMKYILFAILIPFTLLLESLDQLKLDSEQRFTLGYDIVARKVR